MLCCVVGTSATNNKQQTATKHDVIKNKARYHKFQWFSLDIFPVLFSSAFHLKRGKIKKIKS